MNTGGLLSQRIRAGMKNDHRERAHPAQHVQLNGSPAPLTTQIHCRHWLQHRPRRNPSRQAEPTSTSNV
jgi:hypothetical protein